MDELQKIKRALISVSDKSGIVEFGRKLQKSGVTIISTGGTARALREAGIDVTEVAEVTGFPEMMDGRVKTLHPKIHGAFLGLRDNAEHLAAMKKHSIEPIDLVVVNLYPFEETIADEDVRLAEAVEQIDIGGPAMIRSASKNWQSVAVVTDARLYEEILSEMAENDGALSLSTRRSLAALAFTHTSNYDAVIADYLTEQLSDEEFDRVVPYFPFDEQDLMQTMLANLGETGGEFDFGDDNEFDSTISEFAENNGDFSETDAKNLPDVIETELEKIADLRYGENPHQHAALYVSEWETGGVADAEQMHGKEMSYNNYLDADAAWKLVNEFEERACAIIKHTNPSGVGLAETNVEAYRRALATDPVSAFGGIVAFNRVVNAEEAEAVNEIFTEVVIAPEFSEDALEIFAKKKNLRVLLADAGSDALEFRKIGGGMLVQSADDWEISAADLQIVSRRQPTDEEIRALLFAWKVCKHVKSNAIVFANENQTVGVGAGQMNRIDSVRIAAMRAQKTDLKIEGAVLASDAFFPFRDGVDTAAEYKIAAIIQPGGSVRDEEVIAAADEHGMAMVFTGFRHFRH